MNITALTFTVIFRDLRTVVRPLPAVGRGWRLLVSIVDNIGEDVSRLPVRWPAIVVVIKGVGNIVRAVRHGIPTLPPFVPALASPVSGGGRGAVATESRTYIFVLAGWRSIVIRCLVEVRRRVSHRRMPTPYGILRRGIASLARVPLSGVSKGRGMGTRVLRSVVGVMGRGRGGGGSVVVSRPPGRWTGVVIHYRTTGIRTINRDSTPKRNPNREIWESTFVPPSSSSVCLLSSSVVFRSVFFFFFFSFFSRFF